MAEYANIIVDIFNEKLDKTFQYRIPEAMKEKLTLGMQCMSHLASATSRDMLWS